MVYIRTKFLKPSRYTPGLSMTVGEIPLAILGPKLTDL